MLKEYKLSEIDNLKIHGRTNGELDPLTVFWSASGIEINFKGSKLKMRYKADYQEFEPWINVIVNGVRYQKRPLEKGTHEITIWNSSETTFRAEPPVRNIRILRDTPAMSGDSETLFQIEAIYCDGSFEPVKEPEIRMEFIGDSITSGEGCMGPLEEQDWNSSCFDSVDNYVYKTAGKLGAEYNVYSQSGWGICWSWRGLSKENMPDSYEYVCGLVPKRRMEALGAFKAWDFEKFKPDVILINLGTNDVGAFKPEGHQGALDMGYKNEHDLTAEGLIPSKDEEALKEGVKNFLLKIREKNPEAKLFWIYGMLLQDSEVLDDQMRNILEGAVLEYSDENNDLNAHYLQLPVTEKDGFGSRSHPGHNSHENAAAFLVNKIRQYL